MTTFGNVTGALTYTLGDGSPGSRTRCSAPASRPCARPSSRPDPARPTTESASTDVTLVVLKAPQAIDFMTPGEHTYGDAPFDLVATGGDSGQPVTFAADAGSPARSTATTVTITDAGDCTVTASQDGNDDFDAGHAGGPEPDRGEVCSRASPGHPPRRSSTAPPSVPTSSTPP